MSDEDRARIKKVTKFSGVLERIDITDTWFRGRAGKQFQLSFGEVETDQGKFPRFRIWFPTNPEGEIKPNSKAGTALRNIQMLLPEARNFKILQGRHQTWELGKVAIQFQEWVREYPCWLLQDVEGAAKPQQAQGTLAV
jgi:hypothetical protein